jgi:hypothetical protein
MTTRQQDIDNLMDQLRGYVRALLGQGQIGGHENVTAAQAALRDAFKRVLGMKVEESTEP